MGMRMRKERESDVLDHQSGDTGCPWNTVQGHIYTYIYIHIQCCAEKTFRSGVIVFES